MMQYFLLHNTIMAVDKGPSCLFVRHQLTGPIFVQDSDVVVRPHKPKMHHGTALLQGQHPAWNLLLPSPMAILILKHKGFTFKQSARCMMLLMACPVCLSWKFLGNHDLFHSHRKLTLLLPQR